MLQEIVEGHAKSLKGAASITSSTSNINILSKVITKKILLRKQLLSINKYFFVYSCIFRSVFVSHLAIWSSDSHRLIKLHSCQNR